MCVVLRTTLLERYKSYVFQLREFYDGRRSLSNIWRDLDQAYDRYAYYLAKDAAFALFTDRKSPAAKTIDEQSLRAKLKWLVENTKFGEKLMM